MHPRRTRRYTNPRRTQRAQIAKQELRGHSCPWWMELYALIVFLSLSILMSCASITSVSKPLDVTPKPHLAFEEPVYDFGIAGPGQKITHTFKFTNLGSAPLQVIKVGTSCGCTAALLSGGDIQPGSSGEIRATFGTRRYEGKQETTITVHSNDPHEPEIDLTIKGTIKRNVAVVPQGVNFGDVEKGKAITGRVRVLQLSQNNLVVHRIEANDQYLTVNTSRFREENSRGINIEITLKPEVPVGAFSEVITLHTNLKRRPRIDVPVWANIIGNERDKS